MYPEGSVDFMAVVHPTREAYSREIDELFAPQSGSPAAFASPAAGLSVELESLFTATPMRRDTGPLAELESNNDPFPAAREERREREGHGSLEEPSAQRRVEATRRQ